MQQPDQDSGRRRGPILISSLTRRRPSGRPLALLLVLGLVALAAGAGWLWLRSRQGPEAPATTDGVADPPPSPPPAADPGVRPLDLPALDASDAFVRDLAATLSSHPRVAAWLVTDELVRRFVVAAVNLAAGASPAAHLEFMAPEEDFRVREAEGRLLIHPRSYRRYDVLADAFVSLDVEGTARLYRQLRPLIDEAYAELGIPDLTFDEILGRAVANLLAVRFPEEPVEVTPGEVLYEFRDPALEARSDAEKHLLRMGAENGRRVQAKLEELAGALGLPLPPRG